MIDTNHPSRACVHLNTPAFSYHVWFTGVAEEHFRVCDECAKGYPFAPADLIEVDAAWLARGRHKNSCPERGTWSASAGFCHEMIC